MLVIVTDCVGVVVIIEAGPMLGEVETLKVVVVGAGFKIVVEIVEVVADVVVSLLGMVVVVVG